MQRRIRPRSLIVLSLPFVCSVLTGCDYSARNPPLQPPNVRSGPLPSGRTKTAASPTSKLEPATNRPESAEQKLRSDEILKSVITLVQTASSNPGGANFEIAINYLNHYFERGTTYLDFAMSPGSKTFLAKQLPEKMIKELESPVYSLRDARHLEDCMLYNAIATRVAGEGDDLTRVRRLFDWTVRQVQLVPQGILAPNGLEQAQARPYDCLLRGMATEYQGFWAERSWVFMSLCRQIGVDVGLLTYDKPRASLLMTKKAQAANNDEPPVVWITGVAIDKKVYLFDARIGLAIPSLDGKSVATLDEAISDPRVLDRLDLPGQANYDTKPAQLRLSPTKVSVMLDGSSGYLSPRMRLLQKRLTGKNRTILFADPAEQRGRFVEALGKFGGEPTLWILPLQIETQLFSNPQFVASTEASLVLFRGELPLLHARLSELRGETKEAIEEFVGIRFVKNGLMRDKKTPIIPEVQQALDGYATYYLAQSQMDQGNVEQAKLLFQQTLNLLPEPGPGRPAFHMFRWGAQTNLAKINEAQGKTREAVGLYTQPSPTLQMLGNLIKARDLVWSNPFAAPPTPLAPAPSPVPIGGTQTSATNQ